MKKRLGKRRDRARLTICSGCGYAYGDRPWCRCMPSGASPHQTRGKPIMLSREGRQRSR